MHKTHCPKKRDFGASTTSTGFEPVASVFALQLDWILKRGFHPNIFFHFPLNRSTHPIFWKSLKKIQMHRLTSKIKFLIKFTFFLLSKKKRKTKKTNALPFTNLALYTASSSELDCPDVITQT